MQSETQTIDEVLRVAGDRFREVGIPSARLDAELLLIHCLSVNRAHLYAHPERVVSGEAVDDFWRLVERRVQHEPIAYILGLCEFYGRELSVSPSVLIPRPETELLIDRALIWLKSKNWNRRPRILDVGTGSGCIPITLALEFAESDLVAVDISAETLEVAERNARAHSVHERVEFRHSDLFSAVGSGEDFDLIVSNPPYVEETTRDSLQADVVDFEPHHALFAGSQGMDVIRRLAAESRTHISAGGALMFEFGAGQKLAVEEVLAGWTAVEITEDLQGHPRVALAEK